LKNLLLLWRIDAIIEVSCINFDNIILNEKFNISKHGFVFSNFDEYKNINLDEKYQLINDNIKKNSSKTSKIIF
jgi:nucleoside 2-deoxyribosyltransferase